MPKLKFRLPSPAIVIAMVALTLVLGGTAVAAGTSAPLTKQAVTKIVKKLAPKLSVKNSAKLGGAPASAYAHASPLAFIAPVFANAWSDAGGSFVTPGYVKDQFGTVHLTGSAFHASGASSLAIFNLPAGYRPGADIDAPAGFAGPAPGVVRINPNGDVLPISGSTTFVDLDGINFQAGP